MSTTHAAGESDLVRLLRENARLREAETQRDQAEAALRESEQRYRHLVDHANDIIYRADRGGFFTYFNPAAVHVTGYSAEEIMGRFYLDLVHPDYRRAAKRLYVGQLRERIPNTYFEYPAIAKDGSLIWLGQNVQLISDHDMVVGVQAIARNITARKRAEAELQKAWEELERRVEERTAERRRLEEQLLKTQKMESVGRLAGGVAHDFNNMLTAIFGYAQLIEKKLLPEDSVQNDIRQILAAAERAANLTNQLLAFASRQMIAPQVFNLNDLVLDIGQMLRRLIGENIEFVTVMEPKIGAIKADPGQIEQALVNLVLNARDAMPEGGKLTIETANATLDSDYARIHAEVTPGEYVMLAVRDEGMGMDEETRQHLFEPFYTSKEAGKGTGLGLATCYGIVKQAGGHICLDSEQGRGTVFKLFLPHAQEEAEALRRRDTMDVLPVGTETVLLAEDEPQVRDIAARGLRGLGYVVLEASHGGEALRAAEEFAGEIRLLVTDVVMPQMGGRELAQRLRAARPDMRVLFTSGYAYNALAHKDMTDASTAFLQKPYSLPLLARTVRRLLDGE